MNPLRFIRLICMTDITDLRSMAWGPALSSIIFRPGKPEKEPVKKYEQGKTQKQLNKSQIFFFQLRQRYTRSFWALNCICYGFAINFIGCLSHINCRAYMFSWVVRTRKQWIGKILMEIVFCSLDQITLILAKILEPLFLSQWTRPLDTSSITFKYHGSAIAESLLANGDGMLTEQLRQP